VAGIVDPFDTPPAPMDSRLASRTADTALATARLGLVPIERDTARAGVAAKEAEVALKKLEFEREKRWLQGPDYKTEAQRRLALQARTGLPVLSVDYDPNKTYLADPKEYAAAKGRGQQGALAYTAKQDEELQKVRDLSDVAQGVMDAYDSGIQTGGPLSLIPGVGILRTSVDPNAAKVEAAKVAAKRELRVPGDIISNYDATQYNKASPGLDKPKRFNMEWAQRAKEIARRTEDYQTFREAFISQNGTIYGLTTLWRMYNTANPVYAKNSRGSPVINKATGLAQLNTNRVPWQQFFMDRAKSALQSEEWGQANPKPKE